MLLPSHFRPLRTSSFLVFQQLESQQLIRSESSLGPLTIYHLLIDSDSHLRTPSSTATRPRPVFYLVVFRLLTQVLSTKKFTMSSHNNQTQVQQQKAGVSNSPSVLQSSKCGTLPRTISPFTHLLTCHQLQRLPRLSCEWETEEATNKALAAFKEALSLSLHDLSHPTRHRRRSCRTTPSVSAEHRLAPASRAHSLVVKTSTNPKMYRESPWRRAGQLHKRLHEARPLRPTRRPAVIKATT